VREIITTALFRRDYKKIARSGQFSFEEFEKVIDLLRRDQPLPLKYRDHLLKGEHYPHRECHIRPNCLLIYHKSSHQLVLTRIGSHSELFQ